MHIEIMRDFQTEIILKGSELHPMKEEGLLLQQAQGLEVEDNIEIVDAIPPNVGEIQGDYKYF